MSSCCVAPSVGTDRRFCSVASRSERTASTRTAGNMPPAASAAAFETSGTAEMSCPPTAMRSSGGKSTSRTGSVSVVSPTGATRPAASAWSPIVAVVAREPRAPMNHAPTSGVRSTSAVIVVLPRSRWRRATARVRGMRGLGRSRGDPFFIEGRACARTPEDPRPRAARRGVANRVRPRGRRGGIHSSFA